MKACSALENQVLIGYEDGSVALWDIAEHKMVARTTFHPDAVMCLDYLASINRGYCGSVSNTVSSFNINNTAEEQIDITEPNKTDTASPDAVTLCSKMDKVAEVSVSCEGFSDCKVRNDGKIVAFAGWDSNVRVFGCKKLKQLAVLNYHKEGVRCITFADDNTMACGSKDQQISLWDIYK